MRTKGFSALYEMLYGKAVYPSVPWPNRDRYPATRLLLCMWSFEWSFDHNNEDSCRYELERVAPLVFE